MTTTIIDRPRKQPTAYYRKLAATRGARWRHIERDYHAWKQQDKADRDLDEMIRREVWNNYRGDLPDYRWRTGLQHKFRQSFAEGDYTSIPNFDDVARCMAESYPGHFGYHAGMDEESTDDHARLLFDYLQRPPLKRRPAHDVLLELIDKHARREPEPESTFDVDELESTPDRLDMIRANVPPRPKRERGQPAAIGFVELATNIGALCLTAKEALDPTRGGSAQDRDGSQHIKIVPTESPDHVIAVATNGKAVAIVQCAGQVDREHLLPGPIVPRNGARPSAPMVAALDGDKWITGKGVVCGRLSDDFCQFPGLALNLDDRAEAFSVCIDDLVKMGKALGAKRLAFYVPPGDANESPKSIAVMGADPEAAVGYGMLISQPDHLPSGAEFAAAAGRMLGMGDPDTMALDAFLASCPDPA